MKKICIIGIELAFIQSFFKHSLKLHPTETLTLIRKLKFYFTKRIWNELKESLKWDTKGLKVIFGLTRTRKKCFISEKTNNKILFEEINWNGVNLFNKCILFYFYWINKSYILIIS